MVDFEYSMTANGKDIGYLQRMIELRTKELGESTKQACAATAILLLRSLRAQTKVASPSKSNISVTVNDSYRVSYKTLGRGKERRARWVRDSSGHTIERKKFKDIAGKYAKGERVFVFDVVDIVSESKTFQYLVIGHSTKEVKDWAKRRHSNRVKQYAGLARLALTKCMQMLVTKNQTRSDDVKYSNEGMTNVVNSTSFVLTKDNGFDSGDVEIHIHDGLNYAMNALKQDSSIELATERTCNSIIGRINKSLEKQHRIEDKIDIPFPDITK